MSVQFFYPDGKQITFQSIDRKKYRGVLLPGSEVQQNQAGRKLSVEDQNAVTNLIFSNLNYHQY